MQLQELLDEDENQSERDLVNRLHVHTLTVQRQL